MKIADHPRLQGSARPYTVGVLLALAGAAYVGALSDEPTRPSPIAVLPALPAFWGSFRSLTLGRLRTVKNAIAYGVALPWVVLGLSIVAAWRVGTGMLAAGFGCSALAWMTFAGIDVPRPPQRHPGHTKHQ